MKNPKQINRCKIYNIEKMERERHIHAFRFFIGLLLLAILIASLLTVMPR